MTSQAMTFAAFLRDQYEKIFGRAWPVIPSALVIGALNVFLFAFDRPWTAADGLRNWGDWLLGLSGIIDQGDLVPPLLYSGSLLNIGLLLGGLAAALLSREFALRAGPPREMIKGAAGGSLMGWGAMLSFGCNIGGFFSALSALSASGLGMMAGLFVGGFLGARYIIGENSRAIAAGRMPAQTACEAATKPAAPSPAFRLQPIFGAAILMALVLATLFYRWLGHERLAAFLLFGVVFGVIFQRSRFCLVNAFREPFMTGASSHARAAALALMLAMVGFTILKATDLKDTGEWVFPSFWFGALGGGVLFGVGMVLAGGCGAGAIWRAGEGHLKLWVAVLFFALGASMMRRLLTRTDWIRRLGDAVFLPNAVGWGGAVSGVIALMLVWYLLSGWREEKRQAGVLRL